MSSPGARLRASAASAIDAVVCRGRSLDAALAEHEAAIAPDGRSLMRHLCYGVLRRYWRLADCAATMLERPLKSRDSVVHALLLVGLYQLLETRIPDHAAVSETVDATRVLRRPKLAPLVNAILRRALRDRILDNEPSNDEALHDHPDWMLELIRQDWPDDWQDIVAANNARAPMWLRVNRREMQAAEYVGELAAHDIEAGLMDGLPQAVRLSEPRSVDTLPGFAEGRVSVQDAAAQLAAPWLLEGVSGRVLDACAAPGGKTAHLLEMAADRIELTAIDSDALRLASASENLARLHLDATLAAADASKPETWWDRVPFEAILCDAPCSASGVIRRHPDIKVLRRRADIDNLARRQAELLDGLWPLLAKGGRLLYVTCSVFAAENDELVAGFLAQQPDAREDFVLPNNNIHALMRRKPVGGQILPGTRGMDGFYYACLTKSP